MITTGISERKIQLCLLNCCTFWDWEIRAQTKGRILLSGEHGEDGKQVQDMPWLYGKEVSSQEKDRSSLLQYH